MQRMWGGGGPDRPSAGRGLGTQPAGFLRGEDCNAAGSSQLYLLVIL